jgi:hypothetical protein
MFLLRASKSRIIPISAVLMLSLCVANYASAKPRLTNRDKLQIVTEMLTRTLAEKPENADEISDLDLLMRAKGGIVISTRNLVHLVPRVPTVNLLVLTPKEIQGKADSEGDFMYLVFTEFIVNKSRVVVTLGRAWAKAKTSDVMYMSGGADTYEFRKRGSKWVGKFLRGFIV